VATLCRTRPRTVPCSLRASKASITAADRVVTETLDRVLSVIPDIDGDERVLAAIRAQAHG